MINSHLVRTFLAFLIPLAAATSAVLFVSYVQDREIVRLAANEPQVQLAESIAAQINAGLPPEAVVQGGATPLELMQTPFILIYDEAGQILAGNASLAGAAPVLPEGVLGGSQGIGPAGENRVTWQPNPEMREALVIVPYTSGEKKGYVVAGRSLRETEAEILALTKNATLGWGGTMVAVVIVSVIGTWLLRRKKITEVSA